ncbi:cell wall-binding repeat-containing protein [Myceligenerans salitolerans]|uniref:Cell wall-binding repeat-containing protein n=1 Tax=Myceligenerans salitolerans TaxID=1230528 RepID=A0ABS3IAU1_9MICO|nr:cell wall-binding repeat-containing protein [Myceligenerans salitolerans]MBO0609167.1 cell wall-binding repeat-containing protein [Myceligenerans salitolerans]
MARHARPAQKKYTAKRSTPVVPVTRVIAGRALALGAIPTLALTSALAPSAVALTHDRSTDLEPEPTGTTTTDSTLPESGTAEANVDSIDIDTAPETTVDDVVESAPEDTATEPTPDTTDDGAVTLDTTDQAGLLAGVLEVPEGFQTVGAKWPTPIDDTVPELQVRTRALDGTWSDWTHLEKQTDGPDQESDVTTSVPVYVGESDAVQLATVDGVRTVPEGVELVLVSSETVDSPEALTGGKIAGSQESASTMSTTSAETTTSSSGSFGPTIITREEWGAAPRCDDPGDGPTWYPAPDGLEKAAVHHTAGANDYATVAEAMQQIRNDQAFHQDSNGWCDIGYNFLVDKWGNIYEGAAGSIEEPIIGAHTGGWNTGTVGVSMLGNYQEVAPQEAQLTGVGNIIGFKLARYGVDPEGTSTFTAVGHTEGGKYYPGDQVELAHVFGHRDTHATACPGNLGYPLLSTIRATARNWAEHYTAQLPERLAGANRYETSAAISEATFTAGVDVAYVASGRNFPDALSAAAAAGTLDGPVLLTATDRIPAVVRNELERLNPTRIVVVGGEGVVSSEVEATLAAFSANVSRLSGANRWETSAAISAATFDPGVAVAYVANGRNFPDALSGAAAAGILGGPVLLTDDDALPGTVADELDRLRPQRIIVLGGSGVVSTAIEAELATHTSGGVSRLAGGNRWETSAEISEAAFRPGTSVVYIANGRNFPDALSGAAAAGSLGGPVLLTDESTLPSAIEAELDRLDPQRIVVLGGSGVVYDSVRWEAAAYLN